MRARINKFVAQASGLSRRTADRLIVEGKVFINGEPAKVGDSVSSDDIVKLGDNVLSLPSQNTTIMLNKPRGYVCSREGQGNLTIYNLLPVEYHKLKPIGRLDKESSGLLLLTDDGELAYELTHPKHVKSKVYVVSINKPLSSADEKIINDRGVNLYDGISRLHLDLLDNSQTRWQVTMQEGRNRQIRRTFENLGYQIKTLHRLKIGDYSLGELVKGSFKEL